jgi:hypothetical protein
VNFLNKFEEIQDKISQWKYYAQRKEMIVQVNEEYLI